jgi:hypothetical protein
MDGDIITGGGPGFKQAIAIVRGYNASWRSEQTEKPR